MTRKFIGPFFAPDGDAPGGGGTDDLSRDLADLGDPDSDVDPDINPDNDDDPDPDPDSDLDTDPDPDVDPDADPDADDDPDDKPKDKPKDKADPTGRPTIKDIKTFGDGKYKDFFKDFPDVRKAYYQVGAFQEVFADPEEAQVAATKAGEYDDLERSLVDEGDPKVLLKTLSENNPKALKKMVGNFAQSLREVDPDTYTTLTTPVIEELLYYASKHAEKIGNKNLGLAAKHIANFVFNNGGDIPDVSKRAPTEPTEAEQNLQRERETYAKEKLDGALSEVATVASDTISRILGNGVDELTSFERRSLIRDAREEVNSKLKEDKQLQRQLASLWAAAKKANYSPAAKERIKNAWLSRAKQVAPAVRNRLKQEALDARTGEKPPKDKPKGKRTFPQQGGGNRQGGAPRVLDPSKIDWRKTSDDDILSGNDRVALKK